MADDVVYIPLALSAKGFMADVVKEASGAAKAGAAAMEKEFASGGRQSGRSAASGVNTGLSRGDIGVNSVKARMAKLAAEMRGIGRTAGREGAAGINDGLRGVDFGRVGDEHGRRFGRGFVSGARSGIVGIVAAFAVVRGSVTATVRHVGTLATAFKWAARGAAILGTSLLASSTMLRRLAGTGLAKLAGWLRTVATLAGKLARDIARATAAVLVLSAAARGLGTITRVTRMMGLLTVGVSALIGVVSTAGPALVSLGAAIATLGAAAGGAAIAGLSALGAAIGGLKLGVSGVGDAFKAMGTSSGGGGAKAADTAKDIARAEKSLAQAVDSEKEAQEGVTKARDDARKKLRDLDLQLRGAALSEKEAQLDLADARADLAKGGFENSRERDRAVLAVQQAEQRLTEIQRENNDLAADAAKTRANGVDKADEVVEAQKRLKEATQATKDAQDALNDARNPKDTDTGGGVDKQAEALAKLSTNARSFVAATMGVKPAWDAMKNSVQDSLFDGLDTRVQSLAATWIPRLGGALRTVTGGFNQGAKSAADWVNSAQGVSVVSTWLRTSSSMASQFGVAIGNLVPGLAAIGAGAGQAFAPLVHGIGDGAKALSNMLVQAQQSGKIKTFFENAFNSVKTTFQNIAAVAGPAIAVFMKLGQTSASSLAPGLKSIGQAIAQATPGLIQMAERLMPALGQALTNIAPLIPGLVHAFSPWATILAIVAPPLATLVSKMGPFAPLLVAVAVAFKLITVAMTAYNAVAAIASVVQGVFAAATGRSTASLNGNLIALAAHRVAMIAGTIATKAFGIAMAIATSPITWIIVAIGLLVAGLVLLYKKNETFRRFVQTAWSNIKIAIGAVWSWLQTTVWPALQTAFRAVGAAAMWLWRTVIVPAWNGIKVAIGVAWTIISGYYKAWWAVIKTLATVVMWLWRNVITPAFNAIKIAIGVWWTGVKVYFTAFKTVLGWIGTAAMWLWRNVIVPAFNGIKLVIGVVWTVIKAIFNGWVVLFRDVLAPIFGWLWNNIIAPAFRGIGAIISGVWNSIIRPVWDAFKTAITALGDLFTWLWNSIIKPVWDALGDGISWVVDNVIKPAFEGIRTALQTVGDFFGTVVDGIKSVWEKLKGYVATPINFVIGTVWNNGLLKAWNTIAGFLPGLKTMSPLNTVAFADGGPVPMTKGATRGKDSVHALMMPGEHVWDVQDVTRAGGQGAMYRMRNMVEGGRPFTWTPRGLSAASEGGPLPRFEDGGAVSAGDKLAPLSGEGGLKPIAVLMRRIIFKLWKNITTIGGYRQDAYPEHPSGRALDVMVPNAKTGDEVNAWTHANAPKFPIEHTIWQQRWRPQGNPNGQPMEDRGSPTQNHMDHVHTWYKEQPANPDVVPAGLVGFDGISDTDRLNVIKKKISEIFGKALDPVKKGMTSVIGSPPPEWLGIPPKALDETKTKAVETAFDLAGKLGDKLKDAYNAAKKITSTVTNVVTAPGRAIMSLFRDKGGFLPNGLSLVRNETGKPEAVLNWQQLEEVRKLAEATGKSALVSTGKDFADFFGFGTIFDTVSGLIPGGDTTLGGGVADTSDDAVTAGTTLNGSLGSQQGTKTQNDPTYGDGSTVQQGQTPLTTKMPDFGGEGWEKYPYQITKAAKDLGLIKRAAVIGNATALVEVGDPMKMYANNAVPESLKFPHDAVGSDHDSVGLFQQRQAGWGTLAERMDPYKSAKLFYGALVKVDGWETMDMGSAAQAVQRSAFPGRYSGKMDRATQLVDKFGIYDQGGWLKPGGLALNLSKRPEPILNASQWMSIDRMLEALPSAAQFKSVADMASASGIPMGRPADVEDATGLAGRAAGPLVYMENVQAFDTDELAHKTGRETKRAVRADELVGGWG